MGKAPGRYSLVGDGSLCVHSSLAGRRGECLARWASDNPSDRANASKPALGLRWSSSSPQNEWWVWFVVSLWHMRASPVAPEADTEHVAGACGLHRTSEWDVSVSHRGTGTAWVPAYAGISGASVENAPASNGFYGHT